MPNIYALTTEAQDLYDKLLKSVDEETGEVDETISLALSVKREEFEQKAISVASVYRALSARQTELEAEIARLTAINGRLDKTLDRLKNGLSCACQSLGITKLEGLHAKISFRKSEKTVVDDESEIPEEYKTVKVTKTVDKAAIKNAIKSGKEIPGAHIETNKTIQIK